MVEHKATCCCKEISIIVSGVPEINAVCHCNNCKQRTGSAFGISTYFNVQNVIKKSGKTNVYSFYHIEQSHEQKRFFCNKCGTTLYWTVSTMPDLIGISGGCFADSSLPEPSISAANANKYNWVTLPKKWENQK